LSGGGQYCGKAHKLAVLRCRFYWEINAAEIGIHGALETAGSGYRNAFMHRRDQIMHTLPELPYSLDALEPHISRETLDYHYGKHHRAYVDKLNGLIQGTELEQHSLETIVRASVPQAGTSSSLFSNAAQAWNHAFYWQCLTPRPTAPGSKVSNELNRRFGSVDAFRRQFTQVAASVFGSGWAWLVSNEDGTLDIVYTGNADTPLTGRQVPLLTCDVWEHAYYIDYRNARAEYLAAFWDIVNWEFVESNYRKRVAPQHAA
jgi:Fe-Mn family superoxide dismutase